MMTSIQKTGPTPMVENIWAGTLATTSVGGSLLLACMFPFAALATLLAATLPLRKAMLWMGGAWLGNQLVGYLILDYPQTVNSFSHGAGIGVTALATLWIANKIFELRGDHSITTILMAYAGAFVGYQALLALFAVFLGGIQNFMPSIVWQVFQNDVLWFAGLGLLFLALNSSVFKTLGSQTSLQN